MRGPTRREALLGGLTLAAVGLALMPAGAPLAPQVEAFRALIGGHAPASGVESWEEIAAAFFRYDGEAAWICRRLARPEAASDRDGLECLRAAPGLEELADLRRRAIEFFVFGTDLLDRERPDAAPVRFVGVPDPMSGRFCNPVARFDEGAEIAEG